MNSVIAKGTRFRSVQFLLVQWVVYLSVVAFQLYQTTKPISGCTRQTALHCRMALAAKFPVAILVTSLTLLLMSVPGALLCKFIIHRGVNILCSMLLLLSLTTLIQTMFLSVISEQGDVSYVSVFLRSTTMQIFATLLYLTIDSLLRRTPVFEKGGSRRTKHV